VNQKRHRQLPSGVPYKTHYDFAITLAILIRSGQLKQAEAARSLGIKYTYGQEQAKRVLVIAAADHHNILFTDPPETSKTMLARILPTLLPQLSPEKQIAATKLHSLAGEAIDDIINERPFRSPHHTASRITPIIGDWHSRPGEISLAHLSVLFLHEIPQYSRSALEALR
jgi:magnesium chelatase family protein